MCWRWRTARKLYVTENIWTKRNERQLNRKGVRKVEAYKRIERKKEIVVKKKKMNEWKGRREKAVNKREPEEEVREWWIKEGSVKGKVSVWKRVCVKVWNYGGGRDRTGKRGGGGKQQKKEKKRKGENVENKKRKQ